MKTPVLTKQITSVLLDEKEMKSSNIKGNSLIDLNITLISNNEEFESLRDSWNTLNASSLKGNIFTSWEWLFTWWETYQNVGMRQLYILCCTDKNDSLIGLAPFQIINHPKKYFPCGKQLVMLGTGEMDGSSIFGEYMDLLIAPQFESSVITSFSEFLIENSGLWDGLKFHQLLDNSYVSHLFEYNQDRIIKSTKSYGFRTLIELPETYKDYLMSLRKKMRNNITRTFARLEAEKSYSIESIENVENIDHAINILADLNRSRRNDLEQSSAFDRPTFEKYHHKLAKRLLLAKDSNNNSSIDISLRILRFGKEPVAVLYSFIDGDTIHAYQSGFEKENGHRYSLLTMMLTQEISNSIENESLKVFNFMFSDEESTYKRRYSGTTETMHDISYDHDNLKFKLYRFLHGPVKKQVKRVLKRG